MQYLNHAINLYSKENILKKLDIDYQLAEDKREKQAIKLSIINLKGDFKMNVKQIIKDLKENFDKEERKEIINNILEENEDFEVSNYRFINKNNIDEIMKDELSSDIYILGCFNSWFIADITGLDCDIIEKAQKNESFELLGELMLKNIDEVVENYISADGYGHHFGHYDGNENETEEYYYFRIN